MCSFVRKNATTGVKKPIVIHMEDEEDVYVLPSKSKASTAATATTNATIFPVPAIGSVSSSSSSSATSAALSTLLPVSSSSTLGTNTNGSKKLDVEDVMELSLSQVKGVRPWLNGTYLTGSGHATLDSIIGGGLLLQTMTLITTSNSSSSSLSSMGSNSMTMTFLRLFIGEGIKNNHNTIFIGSDELYQQYRQTIPTVSSRSSSSSSASNKSAPQSSSNSPDFQIAWRYKSSVNTNFNLAKTLSLSSQYHLTQCLPADISLPNLTHIRVNKAADVASTNNSNVFTNILTELNMSLAKYKKILESDASKQSNIVRIVIPSLGDYAYGLSSNKSFIILLLDFFRKLYLLTELHPNIVIYSHLNLSFFDPSYSASFSHLCHYHFHLFAFDQTNRTTSAFADYDAFFEIKKLAKLRTFHAVHALQYAQFLLTWAKNGGIGIEPFSLPPEISRNEDNQKDSKHVGCGSADHDHSHHKSSLDF